LYDIITEKERKIYKKFTPYYKSILGTKVPKPILFEKYKFAKNPEKEEEISDPITLQEAKKKFVNLPSNFKMSLKGGRIEAL